MAKSKNAALFEVMTKSRQQPRPGLMAWLGGLFGARRGTPVLTVPKSPSAAGTAQPASAEQMAAVAADGSGAAIPPIAGQGVRRTMLVDSDQGLIYLQLTFTSAAII